MTPGDEAARKAVGRRVLHRLHRRVAMNEAIGILAVSGRCEPDQARAILRADHGRNGEEAEAARVVATSEANARPRSDPDWP